MNEPLYKKIDREEIEIAARPNGKRRGDL